MGRKQPHRRRQIVRRRIGIARNPGDAPTMIFGQPFCKFGCDVLDTASMRGKVVRHQDKMPSHNI
jgi:hypothetical protein